MGFTEYAEDTAIIAALSDQPNDSDGLTADQLKAKFDENAANIKEYINDTLVAELNSTTSGSSGADNVGYGGDIPAVANVKAALDKIYEGGSGSIPPDDTITTAKIVDANVTTAKIADSNITTAKIADDAVTADKLKPAIAFGVNPRANSAEITSSQDWTVPAGVTEVDAWLVGGGGGGNTSNHNGGGGGHCLLQAGITVTPGSTITCVIGAGGAVNNDGGDTSITIGETTYTAAGGGTNGDGGSGGGGFGSASGGVGGSGGSHGMGGKTSGISYYGQPGAGDGILSTINPYTAVLYAGGGGADDGGAGGAGGGGDDGSAGTANTGGGGGNNAAGGSGIIIFYYD